MTWFITEHDDSKIGDNKYSIVGVDEFRNQAYLDELNRNKSNTVSYSIFESINPCKGYNDGSYYLDSSGQIHWGSCEVVSIPETPPPSELPGIDLKVLRIQLGGGLSHDIVPVQTIWEKLEAILKPFGWYIPLMVGEGNQIVIYLGERGSVSLAVVLSIIIGVLALFGIISFSWSVIERDRTIQEAEATEQDAITALQQIANDTSLPQDVREEAAQKLIEITTPAVTQPPALPSKDGGFFSGINATTLIALGLLAVALSRKK